jgi:hypothetical protein
MVPEPSRAKMTAVDTVPVRIGLAAVLLVIGAGCGSDAPCTPYDPVEAKATFDGRVGTVVVENATNRAVDVELYHPDGSGGVEVSEVAGPGATELGAGIGNDWGIRIDDGCVATVGEASTWDGDRFVIRWPDR